MGKLNDYHMGGFYNQIMKSSPLLYPYQFILEFIPGGSYVLNDGATKSSQDFTLFNTDPNKPEENFSYYAQSATIPKFSVGNANVSYYSTQFRVPTVVQYEHNFQCKILLEQDMIMYEKFRTWAKIISDIRNNGGGIKTIPDVSLRLNLLDSTHAYFTNSFILTGVWISRVPTVELAYKESDTTALTATVDFRYQYCYQAKDEELQKWDPLSASNNRLK
jgi:hypothetical protein